MPQGVIEYPGFQPAIRIITAITNAYPALVSIGYITYPGGVQTITSFNHQYVDGMIIKLVVPSLYGMTQVNGKAGMITVTSLSQFTIELDTTFYDTFSIPPLVLIPDENSDILGATISLPPIRQLSDGSYSLEQFAQAIPSGGNLTVPGAAVRNVLPYP